MGGTLRAHVASAAHCGIPIIFPPLAANEKYFHNSLIIQMGFSAKANYCSANNRMMVTRTQPTHAHTNQIVLLVDNKWMRIIRKMAGMANAKRS